MAHSMHAGECGWMDSRGMQAFGGRIHTKERRSAEALWVEISTDSEFCPFSEQTSSWMARWPLRRHDVNTHRAAVNMNTPATAMAMYAAVHAGSSVTPPPAASAVSAAPSTMLLRVAVGCNCGGTCGIPGEAGGAEGVLGGVNGGGRGASTSSYKMAGRAPYAHGTPVASERLTRKEEELTDANMELALVSEVS